MSKISTKLTFECCPNGKCNSNGGFLGLVVVGEWANPLLSSVTLRVIIEFAVIVVDVGAVTGIAVGDEGVARCLESGIDFGKKIEMRIFEFFEHHATHTIKVFLNSNRCFEAFNKEVG